MRNATLSRARELDHPFSMVVALDYTAETATFRREWQIVYESGKEMQELATAERFPDQMVRAMSMEGYGLVGQGHHEEGIALLCQAVTNIHHTDVVMWMSHSSMLLADACKHVDQADAGLRALVQAFEVIKNHEEGIYEAELYRLKGELLLLQSADNHTEPESCFHQALSIARRQQAKSWELRAATSLARLWKSQNKRQEAHDLLAPVYNWFTEGFDTADLKDGKALLEELKG